MDTADVIEPIEFSAVDRALVDTLNSVVGTQRAVAATLAGANYTLRVGDGKSAGKTTHAVRVETPRGGFWLSTADWNQLPGVAATLGEAELDRLPTDMWTAVLSVALEDGVDRLSELMGGPCHVSEVAPVEKLPDGLHPLTVELEGPSPTTVCLWADADGLSWLAQVLDAVPPEPTKQLEDAALRPAIEIGLTVLPVRELEELRRFDLLTIETTAPGDQPLGIVRLGRTQAWRVAIHEGEVELIDLLQLEHQDDPPSDELSVRVTFEQGTLQVPLPSAEFLQPQTRLAVQNQDSVTVRCGGAVIGRGERVLIAGRPAVRLLDLRVTAATAEQALP